MFARLTIALLLTGALMIPAAADAAVTARDKRLVKQPEESAETMEVTPLAYKGKLLLMQCIRPTAGGERKDFWLTIKDVNSGKVLSRFAEGYGLACALIHKGEFYVFASRYEGGDWNDVTMFHSRDLKTWASRLVIRQEAPEHLFNTSVCQAGDRFVMACETNDPRWPAFTIKFAESRDLVNWTKLPDAIFGTDRYTACPCLRYLDGRFYMMYLEHKTPEWRFETYMARSADLKQWEMSPRNPILAPEGNEGVNASDPDIAELGGRVYLYYATGDQKTWAKSKRAVFNGTLPEFLRWCYQKPAK